MAYPSGPLLREKEKVHPNLPESPIPQGVNSNNEWEPVKVTNGATHVKPTDTSGTPVNPATEGTLNSLKTVVGATTDAETDGDGSLIAITKKIRTKLGQVVLAAGNAVIGKVGIDQSIDGTTNKVHVGNFPAGFTANQGTAGVDPWPVKLNGSLLALNPNYDPEDPESPQYVELTAVQDNEGKYVLRTVLAAEVAYDEQNDAKRVSVLSEPGFDTQTDSKRVQITNPNTPIEIITLVDSELRTTSWFGRIITAETLKKYRDFDFIIWNTLDAEIRIGFSDVNNHGIRYQLTDGTFAQGNVDQAYCYRIPAGVRYIPLSSVIPGIDQAKPVVDPQQFKKLKSETMKLGYQAVSAPTSGFLRIDLVGVPN